jgi:hypothetical protein
MGLAGMITFSIMRRLAKESKGDDERSYKRIIS